MKTAQVSVKCFLCNRLVPIEHAIRLVMFDTLEKVSIQEFSHWLCPILSRHKIVGVKYSEDGEIATIDLTRRKEN